MVRVVRLLAASEHSAEISWELLLVIWRPGTSQTRVIAEFHRFLDYLSCSQTFSTNNRCGQSSYLPMKTISQPQELLLVVSMIDASVQIRSAFGLRSSDAPDTQTVSSSEGNGHFADHVQRRSLETSPNRAKSRREDDAAHPLEFFRPVIGGRRSASSGFLHEKAELVGSLYCTKVGQVPPANSG